jgi:hypothetical protein
LAIAGIAGSVMSLPFDNIKTRLQKMKAVNSLPFDNIKTRLQKMKAVNSLSFDNVKTRSQKMKAVNLVYPYAGVVDCLGQVTYSPFYQHRLLLNKELLGCGLGCQLTT